MKTILFMCAFGVVCLGGVVESKQHQPLTFVAFDEVHLNDAVWHPRIEQLVTRTLPHAFAQTQVAQERLRLCAEYLESGGTTPKPFPHRFNTSDLYKVMEGAALMIKAEPNAEIEAMMDRTIDVIARAQQQDGYLYVPHITDSFDPHSMGDRPYSHVVHSHELYNVGHLYEAAVAYAQATGKTKLLDVVKKNAQHVNRVFFHGDPNYNAGKPVMQAPGHQEIELALVKLYRFTGDELYLNMAKQFLDIRGVTFMPTGSGTDSPAYAQQHAPVSQQTEAVGHAVRATYLYTAMAEVDSLTGGNDYTHALNAIWHDIVDRKMHITGGLGAVHGIEGFGPAYVLPNKDAYLETCAAVGNVFFNTRMFLKYGDAKFIDVAEVALYNNCLSGYGLDGETFFYPNPLEADFGHRPRSAWFGTACCPSNIARLIPQISGYAYATDGQDIYCNLYAQSSTEVETATGTVGLEQTTDYPWSGDITLKVEPQSEAEFTLCLRIPTWVGERLLPSELYTYSEPAAGWTIEVNGKPVEPPVERGFARLERTWKRGDRVTLRLPMPVKANHCIDRVEANRDRVCFSRGPIVLCAEGIDNDAAVQQFFVNPIAAAAEAKVATLQTGALAGLPQVEIPARKVAKAGEASGATLRLIPYFAWSNRDRSSMITWIPTREELTDPKAVDEDDLKFADVKASHTFQGDTVLALRLHESPKSSADRSIRRWTSWPQKGRRQWVEIEFENTKQVRSVGVYFYHDNGGVQLPGEWWLEAPDDGNWRRVEIYNTDEYSKLENAYNTVHPAVPLRTDKLRIVMTPRHGETCVGILSVNVDAQDQAE